MISSLTAEIWAKEGRESQRRLRFTLHFLPTRPENAVLRRTRARRVFWWDTTQTTRRFRLGRSGRALTSFSVSAVCSRLWVSQAAADDPDERYHYRGNAEYNQVFHFVISLFDW